MIESLDTTALCYDDILLVPGLSNISSRSSISLEIDLGNPKNPDGAIHLFNPLVIAPMEYISSVGMLSAIVEGGGLGFIHRFQSKEDRINTMLSLSENKYRSRIGIAIGISDIEEKFIKDILSTQCRIILLDIAFSHTKIAVESVAKIRSMVPSYVHIMTGNSSSAESYLQLMEAGADSVRIGIGGGAACTTRMVTGFGTPVLGSIMDIYEHVKNDPINGIVADGGIKSNGDIVKALAAGASAVMMGSMFAGYDECDGQEVNGAKPFRGLASTETQADNYPEMDQSTIHSEGVAGYVRSKGPAKYGIIKMYSSVKSGLSYTGASNLKEFRDTVKFIRVSQASILESNSRI